MKVLDKKLDTDKKPQTQKNIGFIGYWKTIVFEFLERHLVD